MKFKKMQEYLIPINRNKINNHNKFSKALKIPEMSIYERCMRGNLEKESTNLSQISI